MATNRGLPLASLKQDVKHGSMIGSWLRMSTAEVRGQMQHDTAKHLPGCIIHKRTSVEISCYGIHVAVPRCTANAVR
jgi:hypothetical protein